jgi:CSLREA domain-containing protein/uncharacterized repeat protein (TIGR01451 family)
VDRRTLRTILFMAVLSLVRLASAATITVNSSTDVAANDGVCTLREAIIAANDDMTSGASAGECAAGSAAAPDSIVFNIAGAGVHTISVLTSPLPPIEPTAASPVTIDGFTQPGASANTLATGSDAVYRIRLDGVSLGASAGTNFGLRIWGTSGGNTVRGFVITRFMDGGILLSAPNSTIEGNFVGVTETGTSAGNGNGGLGLGGIVIRPEDIDGDLDFDTNAAGNTIGGTVPADRNVIAGNIGPGIRIIDGVPSDAFTADQTTVIGNYIGTNPGGTSALSQSGRGISIFGADNTTIGSTTGVSPGVACTGGCNLISGNLNGIFIEDSPLPPDVATETSILANYIGTDVTGSNAIGNGADRRGVVIFTAGLTQIGDGTASGRNVISGHLGGNGDGIALGGTGIATIRGNYIGTDDSAANALGNGGSGISVTGISGTIIGGAAPGHGNVISGNGASGVPTASGILLAGATNTTIQGNLIGVGADGTTPIGNAGAGVRTQSGSGITSNNVIGATSSGGTGGNIIANNGSGLASGGGGVVLVDSDGVSNRISTNSIHSNSGGAGLAIDLGGNGLTADDGCDEDLGANLLQNAPGIFEAVTTATTTTVFGSLVSKPDTTFTIEVYRNNAGEGELRTFLGSTVMTTNALCAGPWSLTAPVPSTLGTEITAIAIDPSGNTSEVSSAVLVTPPPLEVAKAFSPTATGVNVEARLTITIRNTGTGAASDVAFTDTFPAGVNPSGAPDITNTCAGSVTTGANSVTLSGGSIAAGSSCSVGLDVVSSTPGSYVNSINIGDVTSSTVPANTNNTNATLDVLFAPQIEKLFAPDTINSGATATLRVTLRNTDNASTAITGISFADTYPPGLVNASPLISSTTCGGTIMATAGAGGFSFSGGTIPAAGSCVVEVGVTATAAGSYDNTIAAGAVTSTNAGSNSSGASATLTVTAPLSVTKAFATDPIGPGGTSVLTITITNPNAFAVTDVALTDSYPASLANAASPNASTTCGGSVTATAGGGSLSLTGGTVPASGSCTVTVTITSSTPGTHTNTIPAGGVTTANAGSSAAAASDALTVNAPPTVAKAFAPSSIAAGGTSVLTITLTNPNAAALTGAALTDSYPVGVTNAASPAASTSCGGSVTAVAGDASLSLSGGTIPANGSCTVSVSVTSSSVGAHENTVAAGDVTTANGGSNTAGASATLTVSALAPPTVGKSFTPAAIAPGQNAVLTITLSNTNGTTLTGVTLNDTYPVAVTNAAAPNASTTCGGTVTAAANGSGVSLAGGVIPANGSCTITVTVTSGTSGAHQNVIAAGGVTSTEAGPNGDAASATLTVSSFTPVAVTKTFAPAAIAAGQTSSLTITLTNTNGVALTDVAFTDTYPIEIVNAAAPNASTTCGGSVTATAGGGSLSLTGGTVPAFGSCSVTVTITATLFGGPAENTIPAGAVTTNEAVTNSAPGVATLTIAPLLPPDVSKSFAPASAPPGQITRLTITLTNHNAVPITGVAFTDAYPVRGFTNAPNPAVATTCGGSVTATAAGGSVALTGGTIPASGSCTVAVDVVLSAGVASAVNTIPAGGVTSANAPPSGAAASATLSAALTQVPALSPSMLLLLSGVMGAIAVALLRR